MTRQQSATEALAASQQSRGLTAWGWPVGHIYNARTGSEVEIYADGYRREIALPACGYCDRALEPNGDCDRCEITASERAQMMETA